MIKTERLYYTDCYLREFEARVIQVEPGPKGVRVFLDRTAFYPESGGQPTDHGELAGIPVLEVTEDGESLAHHLERRPENETVKGKIDWERRFDHMQQHSGQHIFSAAFEKTGAYKTVSFHLGAEVSAIGLDSDRLGRRQIEEAENLANQVVFENREVRIFFRLSEDAARLDLRKPTARQGDLRLVEIENFDLSACGGTHVSRTGAVGLIVARKVERTKDRTRVEFLCGGRALAAARNDFLALSEIGRSFSASLDQAPALVAKHLEDLRAAQRVHEKLLERLAEYKARELLESAAEKRGIKIVRQIFNAESGEEAKMTAHAVAAQPGSIALIGAKGQPAKLYFAQSPEGRNDMGALLKQALSRLGGKGGGMRDFAQGGGIDEGKLEEALALAEILLSSS